MSRPLVLLLRAPAEPDPYVAALDARGFDSVCLPVLRFDFVGTAALAERLRQWDRFGGLVLTSTRAVQALAAYRGLLTPWADRPTFVVGPATAEAARALGLRPLGEEAGNGEALAGRILADPPSAPLLFLAGDRRRDTLPEAFTAAGVPFEELTVYRTAPQPVQLPVGLRPDWAVFFSPSGVESVMGAAAFPWNRLRTAAIGPTTADALRLLGRPPSAVAETPTPAALAEAIVRAH